MLSSLVCLENQPKLIETKILEVNLNFKEQVQEETFKCNKVGCSQLEVLICICSIDCFTVVAVIFSLTWLADTSRINKIGLLPTAKTGKLR